MTETQLRIAEFENTLRTIKEISKNLRGTPIVYSYGLNFLNWATGPIPDAYQIICDTIYNTGSGAGGPDVKYGKQQPAADFCYQPSSNGAAASRLLVGMRGDGSNFCGDGTAEQAWAKKLGSVPMDADQGRFNSQYPIWRRITTASVNYTCAEIAMGHYHIGEIVAAIRSLPEGWPAVETLRPLNLRAGFVPRYE